MFYRYILHQADKDTLGLTVRITTHSTGYKTLVFFDVQTHLVNEQQLRHWDRMAHYL